MELIIGADSRILGTQYLIPKNKYYVPRIQRNDFYLNSNLGRGAWHQRA